MNPMLSPQSLLTILLLVSVAAITSSLIYFALRFTENRFQNLSRIAIPIAFAIFFFWSLAYKYNPEYLAVLASAPLGAILHRKSCDNPKGFLQSFILMYVVGMSGMMIFNYLFMNDIFHLLSFNRQLLGSISASSYSVALMTSLVWILVRTQFITTPFLIWVWRSYRLRPGMDKHLES